MAGPGFLPILGFTRTSTAPYTDATGSPQVANVNEARADYDAMGNYLGLLIQSAALAGAIERLSGAIDGSTGPPRAIIMVARTQTYTNDQTLWQIDDDSADNVIRLLRNALDQIVLQVTSADALIVDLAIGTVADNTEFEVRLTMSGSQYDVTLDQGQINTVAGAIPPVTTRRIGGSGPNTIKTGAQFNDGSDWTLDDGSQLEFVTGDEHPWDGHIKRSSALNRALSNIELTA